MCNVIWPPVSRNNSSIGGKVGQQTVADDSADADRPQPRGEAEEEYRHRDPPFRCADAGLHSIDDAVEQCVIGVELLQREPATVDRPGAHGEVLVDL